MLQLPIFSKHYERTNLDSVYKALRSNDLSDCVVLAREALKESNNFFDFNKEGKSASKSISHGVKGKKAFCEGNYQIALIEYNTALMFAPLNSEAMRLSYFGRAELLLKTEQFLACDNDIKTCLTLNCPDSLVQKLHEMKAQASQYAWMETLVRHNLSTPFSNNFFNLKGECNPDIPCASTDVEVIIESDKTKVIATEDIPAGSVVAVETAFISTNHAMNHFTSCHYCHKMTFNLMPCDECCNVLFCDIHCKEKAMQEGHEFECKIINMLLDDVNLPVKAVFKIRHMCSSWDEFITASDDLKLGQMKNSPIKDIFGTHKFTLLNTVTHSDFSRKHFIFGSMFNICLYLANVIHVLEEHTSFFPNSPEDKSAAIRAASRVMMYLALYCNPVQLQYQTAVCSSGEVTLHNHPNKGYFPLIGKLANSCLPNSYVVGLRNRAAVVTIAPIKKGTELTHAYIGHYLEIEPSSLDFTTRVQKLFIHYRMVCEDCVICGGRAVQVNHVLNNTQKRAFKQFMCYRSNSTHNLTHNTETNYKQICKIMEILSDVPCSEEYLKVFSLFIQYLMFLLQLKFPNIILKRYV